MFAKTFEARGFDGCHHHLRLDRASLEGTVRNLRSIDIEMGFASVKTRGQQMPSGWVERVGRTKRMVASETKFGFSIDDREETGIFVARIADSSNQCGRGWRR